ncbi:hypothetical protein SAMN02927923_02938 [Microvirga guangxiensis]|uniref:Uncharacterized protein n=1 Tax=Microvirga guangxiensis TaxID=549386 RepID=A0A1G5JZ31_9HYPH|nr:hypothetical protein SAMN02927923_02938 [Microvirga guangxiensis]
MIRSYQRIDDETMILVRSLAEQFGCSVEIALKFLLKTGRHPQEVGEDDETYAARLESLPDPYIWAYCSFDPANDACGEGLG